MAQASVIGGDGCVTALSRLAACLFVLVPLFLSLLAALLALPLWHVECHYAPEDELDEASCALVEWWLYVMGNVIGLATPLTDYRPRSERGVSLLCDALIATVSDLNGMFP